MNQVRACLCVRARVLKRTVRVNERGGAGGECLRAGGGGILWVIGIIKVGGMGDLVTVIYRGIRAGEIQQGRGGGALRTAGHCMSLGRDLSEGPRGVALMAGSGRVGRGWALVRESRRSSRSHRRAVRVRLKSWCCSSVLVLLDLWAVSCSCSCRHWIVDGTGLRPGNLLPALPEWCVGGNYFQFFFIEFLNFYYIKILNRRAQFRNYTRSFSRIENMAV